MCDNRILKGCRDNCHCPYKSAKSIKNNCVENTIPNCKLVLQLEGN